MSEWRECKLKDICVKITDGSHNSPPTTIHGYPMASVKDMEYNRINLDTCRKISEDDYIELVKNDCKPILNDVLIAKDGSYLKHVFDVTKEENVVLLSSIAIIRPDILQILPKYLKYIFLNPSFRDTVEANYVTGAVIPRIVLKDFKEIDILLPPLPEQRAIASVLSSLDDKIDLLHRQNKTLEAMAETLFRQWFVEEADEGWEIKKLSELVVFEKGKKPYETFEIEDDGLVPQILIESFDSGKYMFSRPEETVIAGEKDILVVMDGASSGRVEIGYHGIIGSTIGLFRPTSIFPFPLFLYSFLKLNEKYIRENTTGSAIPHADKALILDLEVQYSRRERVKQFEAFAQDLFKKKKSNREQIRTLEKLRDTLLPKLMSGEVRVIV
ncbi:MAG TPA: restriction endonuclease subunit S [Syntrophorhabdus sp.]|nr:restriction endonuclease subunit S [Syntrophorhabdus sp.]